MPPEKTFLVVLESSISAQEKWLNAKPCGILDSAHMTHGLNP